LLAEDKKCAPGGGQALGVASCCDVHEQVGINSEDLVRRGLKNEKGANHCFLNATIQALWHIRSFRRRFLEEPDHSHELPLPSRERPVTISTEASSTDASVHGNVSPTAADTEILASDVVDVGAVVDSASSVESSSCSYVESCCYCALKTVFKDYCFAEADILPPDVLRNALSSTYTRQGRFKLGEMEDATEALEALLENLHATHLCKCISGSQAPVLSTQEAQEASPVAKEEVVGSPVLISPQLSPVVEASSPLCKLCQLEGAERLEAASDIVCTPPCIAHEIFGIEYVDMTRCNLCNATGEPVIEVKGSPFLYRVYVAEIIRMRKATLEAIPVDWMWASQGTKENLEEYLQQLCQGRIQGKCCECNSLWSSVSDRWLTRCPQVFMISLIWPTRKPSHNMLVTILNSLRPHLRLGNIFRGVAGSASSVSGCDEDHSEGLGDLDCHVFCAMICYNGCHYIALCWSPVRATWLLFDDERIRKEGDWKTVYNVLISIHCVPTLVFYEKRDCTASGESFEELKRQMGEVEESSLCCMT